MNSASRALLGGCPRMPFSPNSLSCQKKLSSEYQLYACGNFFRHSSIFEKIAILGQSPRTFKRNIAKGFDSDTNPEFVRVLKDAKRSCTEVSLVSA